MALGPRDTTSLTLQTGWDATALQKYSLQDGTTYAAVIADINAAIGALNAEFANSSLWSGLISYQDDLTVDYTMGATNGFGQFTEYGRPDSKRADIEGHMLPILAYDRGLGWTWDYLRKARMSQVEADIASAINDARDLLRVALLTRLFKRGDDSGVTKGLGAAGLSPGFATTAASTGVDFTPPSYGGQTFTSTHEHYVAIAGGYTNAAFADVKSELMEHGHMPPFTFLASPLDETAIRALTDFIPIGSSLVRYGTTVDVATISPDPVSPGVYPIGVISDVVIYIMPGIPQYYGVGYKSYGRNSARNPLRIRLQTGETAIRVQAFQDPRSGAGAAYPLQYAMLFTEFGVGVSDRTVATPRYVNNATWADAVPT